jgi:hypothetical protein
MKITRLSTVAALCAAACAPAWAAGTWDFSVCNGSTAAAGTATGSQTGAGAVGNSYACAATGSTTRDLSVSAWGAVSTTNNTFATGFLTNEATNGFGVGARSEGGTAVTSPNHALDNDPTTLVPNLIVLRFSSAVILDKVKLGWSMSDADLTVMAYTGAGTPSTFLAGKTATNLTTGGASAGWSLIQSVGDAAPDTAYAASDTDITRSVNQAGISSAYWLISAYNASFGGAALDSLVDYAKLLAVSTRDAVRVPEPASLGLVAAALLAVWSTRRRAAARQAASR